MLSLAYLVVRWMFGTVAWTARSPTDQALEILVLRHQLDVLKRQVARPQLQPRDRVLLAAASSFSRKRSGHRSSFSRDAAQVAPSSGHTPGGEMGEQEPGPASSPMRGQKLVCFDGNGNKMYVNQLGSQEEPGVTYAIWGPWKRQ